MRCPRPQLVCATQGLDTDPSVVLVGLPDSQTSQYYIHQHRSEAALTASFVLCHTATTCSHSRITLLSKQKQEGITLDFPPGVRNGG